MVGYILRVMDTRGNGAELTVNKIIILVIILILIIITPTLE